MDYNYNNNVSYSRPHFSFMDSIKAFFKNYAKFDGRASRSEFWWTYLAYTILTLLLVVPLFTAGAEYTEALGDSSSTLHFNTLGEILIGALILLGLVSIIPNISLTVRRLHDVGSSGWTYLISFIPYIGSFVVLVLCAKRSNPDGQKYDGPVQPWAPNVIPNNSYDQYNMNNQPNNYNNMPYPTNNVNLPYNHNNNVPYRNEDNDNSLNLNK